ncbi:MAG: enoyl-CoA hydratase [Pseudomonadota bacterium]
MTDAHSLHLDDQGIATLAIHGRKSLNIVGTPEISTLTACLQQLADEPRLRVLVLRGRDERAFIGGADIHEMALLTADTAPVFITRLKNLCEALRLFPVPVIAQISGWCLGGGLEAALACDLRLGSSDSKYGMPEVKVGIPSVIHAALLPRRVGPAAATWLLLTGETIDATEAQRLDLLHQVHAPEALGAATHSLAQQLAGLGTQVLRQQKRMLRDWERQPVEESISHSVAEFGRAFSTGEPQRYMQAFVDRKR